MKSHQHDNLPEYNQLSSPEKTVYDIIMSGKVPDHDVNRIAKVAGLSEMHVRVAMQLLFLRKITDINPKAPGTEQG